MNVLRQSEWEFPSWLIASKVEPDRQDISIVDRPRLLKRLDDSLEKKLALICAPAGFGKTVLMNTWRDHLLERRVRVAWLSLDGDDNQAGVLATYLAFALHRAGLQSDTNDLSAQQVGEHTAAKAVIGNLASALAADGRQFVLMLDGTEWIGDDGAVAVVDSMLKYFPKNIQIVLAGRSKGHFRVSDLRLHGSIAELDADDLKFTPPETRLFLEPELDKVQLREAEKIAEGWPVALRFLKMALVVDDDRKLLLQQFAGTRPEISDYFTEQVRDSLPAEQEKLLSDASILECIDSRSVDFVRDRTDSQVLLDDMQELNGFVVSDTDDQKLYRIHPLLKDFLSHQLKVRHPDRYQALHRRAAEWIAQKGHMLRAMKYALEIGDAEMAADIVEAYGGLTNWDREGVVRLRAVHSLLPDRVIVSRPRLHLIRALVFLKDGRLTDARQILQHVRDRSADSDDEYLRYEIAVVAATIHFYEGSDPTTLLPELMLAIQSGNEDLEVRTAFFHTLVCVAGLQYGRFRDARESANKGIASGMSFSAAYFHLHLGALNLAEGRFQDAISEYRKAQAIYRRDFRDDKDMKLVANVLTAEWHFERNDLATAKRLLGDTNKRLVHGEAWYEIYAAGYTTSSAIAYELEGLPAAREEIEGAVEYIQKEGLKRLKRLVVANSCGFLTRSGEAVEARKLVQENGLSLDEYKVLSDDNRLIRERFGIVPALCRLLIAENRFQQAVRELSLFIDIERRINHRRAILKYSLLLSLALFRTKKRRRGVRPLDRRALRSPKRGIRQTRAGRGADDRGAAGSLP